MKLCAQEGREETRKEKKGRKREGGGKVALISIVAYTQKTKLKLRSEMKVGRNTEKETEKEIPRRNWQRCPGTDLPSNFQEREKAHESRIECSIITPDDLFQILDTMCDVVRIVRKSKIYSRWGSGMLYVFLVYK